ncbi:MAG: glycosyltransferase family 2 protein [Bacteroidales bacterium]
MSKKISLVIPVHNRLEYTKSCLSILKDQEKTSFFTKNQIYIILVNDGSTDETNEWVSSNYPEVIILEGDGNLWYSGSLNKGFRHALYQLGCDFVLIWENDIFPGPGYFNNLQALVESWDGNSIITSKLYYKSQPNLIFGLGGTFNKKTGQKSLIGWREEDGPKFNQIIELDWFLGHMALIHKDIIARIGLMDEKNFPQYHADIDYSLRATEHGFKNIVYPELKLMNDTGTTGIHQVKNKTIKQFFESFTSIRSNNNIRKDIIFLRIHTKGLLPYLYLFKRYLIYTGSFVKWKTLGYFGVKRKNENLLVD